MSQLMPLPTTARQEDFTEFNFSDALRSLLEQRGIDAGRSGGDTPEGASFSQYAFSAKGSSL